MTNKMTIAQQVRIQQINERHGEALGQSALQYIKNTGGIANDVSISDVISLASIAKTARDDCRVLVTILRECRAKKKVWVEESQCFVVNFYAYELEALIKDFLEMMWKQYRLVHRDHLLHLKNAMDQCKAQRIQQLT